MIKKKSIKICFISSTGGHFEQIRQLKKVAEQFDHYYILPMSNSTKNFNEKKYLINKFSRNNKFTFPFLFFWTSLQQLFIYIKEHPDVIITTGAGIAYPTCRIGKLFGSKVIYIESFARMKTLNVTGKKLYPYADLFIVQWKELLKLVPKAIYKGWIY